MTLAQFAIARVAAGLVERKADGLAVGEARLLETLAPAVARYEAREAGAGEVAGTANIRRTTGERR